MTDELHGDPTEYNPDRSDEQDNGDVSTQGVPEIGNGVDENTSTDGSHTFKSWDCDWDGDALWFNCPYCGRRLCSAWFFQRGSTCNGCGATVNVQVTVSR